MKSFPAFGILLGSRGSLKQLQALLEENSGLPGPRANLELVASFAEAVSRMHLEDWQWDYLLDTAGTSPSKAPENTPRVYVSICSLVALGALSSCGGGSTISHSNPGTTAGTYTFTVTSSSTGAMVTPTPTATFHVVVN